MKKLHLVMILVLSVFMFTSCGLMNTKPVAPCLVNTFDGTEVELSVLCAEIEMAGATSYICDLQKEYNVDACVIHRSLEVIAKEGLILEGYTAAEFKIWANWVVILIKNGITYGDLKTMILAQCMKINKMVGAQVLILGDMFIDLPQDQLIPEADIEIVVSSIEDLTQEVLRLDMWI